MLSRYPGVNGAGGEGLFLLKKHAAVNSKWIKRVTELRLETRGRSALIATKGVTVVGNWMGLQ